MGRARGRGRERPPAARRRAGPGRRASVTTSAGPASSTRTSRSTAVSVALNRTGTMPTRSAPSTAHSRAADDGRQKATRSPSPTRRPAAPRRHGPGRLGVGGGQDLDARSPVTVGAVMRGRPVRAPSGDRRTARPGAPDIARRRRVGQVGEDRRPQHGREHAHGEQRQCAGHGDGPDAVGVGQPALDDSAPTG